MDRHEPAAPIRLYGTEWCGSCRIVRAYLDQQAIPYEWIDADDDPQAEAFVLSVNHGMRSVPTLVFPDGTLLVEPSLLTLARKLVAAAGA